MSNATTKKVAVLGAGPITIGQACEFDYSGTQACQALKEENIEVVLINSNPATIMTDPNLASSTYVEPMSTKTIIKILKKEKPNSILPTMGGQTALNCLLELHNANILEELDLECLGVSPTAVANSEDREKFKTLLTESNIEHAGSHLVTSLEEATEALSTLSSQNHSTFPVIVRPSFTLGGEGGGIACSQQEFENICASGLRTSPVGEILIEESLLGWKEYEVEVVKDYKDNCIAVCTIENVDPMGVHTGDSVTVAPAQTLTDYEYQKMRDWAFAVVRKMSVQSGCVNVQFAVCPQTGRMLVVEMNPRVSRSSALASKATGFPIARISTKLSIGYSLDELRNRITSCHLTASFEPTIDYVIVKMPRFSFEKFPGVQPILTTQMQSVGEVMGIGRTFGEAWQKALRSLDYDIDPPKIPEPKRLKAFLCFPNPHRMFAIVDAFRLGISLESLFRMTCIDYWFLYFLQATAKSLKLIANKNLMVINRKEWYALKQLGLGDGELAMLWSSTESAVTYQRRSNNVRPVFKRIDTCAAEFMVITAYLYSTYEEHCEAQPSLKEKVIVLGGGPNRIGQGLEFDYCCVHSISAVRNSNIESILINSNPETVSTDYNVSDKLYFEPLSLENIEEINIKEIPLGIIVQFGGQTPLQLAEPLEKREVKLLGTSSNTISTTEDRNQFKSLLSKTTLKQPENCIALTADQVTTKGCGMGFPLILRPSYVLGGSFMKIISNQKELSTYVTKIKSTTLSKILVERFLEGAVECDVDCVGWNANVLVAGIMEHIEQAGVHSGDSACSMPPYSLEPNTLSNLREQIGELSKLLRTTGLMNIQFAIQNPGTKNESIYVLEVNPRASRSVPYVSKTIGLSIVEKATSLMLSKESMVTTNNLDPKFYAVKESVLPFTKFPHSDSLLGPEMQSTGEVMGIGRTFGEAWQKAQLASSFTPHNIETVILAIDRKERIGALQVARWFQSMGHSLQATRKTFRTFKSKGLKLKEKLFIDSTGFLISTSGGDFKLRGKAQKMGATYCSTIRGCLAFIEGQLNSQGLRVYELQNKLNN